MNILRQQIEIENYIKRMWNQWDCNKIVGTQMKVESYKNHVLTLKKSKSVLKIQVPWTPSFSLSKRKNKYHKSKDIQTKIKKQNNNLLARMMEIQAQPFTKTINYIPPTIPSNTQTFSRLKKRERKHQQYIINKENMKILGRIESVNSPYGKEIWKPSWKDTMRYKDNISKKEFAPDYYELLRQIDSVQKTRIIRPRTAHPFG